MCTLFVLKQNKQQSCNLDKIHHFSFITNKIHWFTPTKLIPWLCMTFKVSGNSVHVIIHFWTFLLATACTLVLATAVCSTHKNPKQIRLPFNQRPTTHKGVYSVMLMWPFCSYNFDPMTLIYELDLDILKMYPPTRNEVSRSRHSKVKAWIGETDRHTDTTEHITMRAVITKNLAQNASYDTLASKREWINITCTVLIQNCTVNHASMNLTKLSLLFWNNAALQFRVNDIRVECITVPRVLRRWLLTLQQQLLHCYRNQLDLSDTASQRLLILTLSQCTSDCYNLQLLHYTQPRLLCKKLIVPLRLVVTASDCGVREPRFESPRGRLCLSRQPLRYTALGTGCAPLLQCLGRLSLLPSVGG